MPFFYALSKILVLVISACKELFCLGIYFWHRPMSISQTPPSDG